MPFLLLTPLAMFVFAISGVRTRRSASNLATFGAVVTLALTLLIGWGLAKKSTPYELSYPYINLPVAFSGPINFQGFGIDIVLRVDHLTVAALVVVELCVIGALGWHRYMGRVEPGAARFHALVSLFLFACVGALVSYDLAELLAFWGLAGAVTYLLLAHRWSVDTAARSTRIALALPFLTDLILLLGVSVVYSRYGVLNLTTLLPILSTTPGATVKALAIASILLFVGVGGRLALWPLQSWVTRTSVDSPAAASAMTQAAWSVIAIVVLYRLMPIAGASNMQTLRALLYACAATAVIAPLLALATNEPRRAFALLGIGATAVGAAVVVGGSEKVGFTFTFAVAGVACVLAGALARVAGIIAASTVAAAMRTDDIAEMGDAWRRMRGSAIALLIAGVVLGLSASGALAYSVSSGSKLGLVLGEAVLLIAVGSTRIFLAIAIGPLRRRRAFEPDRVRDIPASALGWAYVLALAGAALVAASMAHGWLDFLDGRSHPSPNATGYVLWVAVGLVGFAAAAIAFRANKDGANRASTWAGTALDRSVWRAEGWGARLMVAPAAAIAAGADEWSGVRDDALGLSAVATGRIAALAARVPVVPAVILLAVVLAVVLGLISPGVFR
ncbi:MAG TPA: proton-conducting transporter membrane subunit [Candidatus Acidoferrum sp.]|nr:proton-conducting transporter membrane subunit [Candidatus Acidoferrum sp.]